MTDILELDRAGFRQWLSDNHDKAKECRIRVQRGKGPSNFLPYLDSVEEALCFGWIDSTQRKDGKDGCIQRFSPRRPGSRFSRLNLARCERMESLGLMTEYGRNVIPEKGFSIDEDIIEIMNDDPVVKKNIVEFPALYVEIRIDNIQYLRTKDRDLFEKRLDKFLSKTREGKMFGKWDDDGNLPHTPLFTLPRV